MARPSMVTRTITITECVVLCMDTELQEAVNITVTLSGTYPDNEKMLKAVKKTAETDTVKPVQVCSYSVKETLYGMTEQEFIANAEELPPRGKTE